MEIAATRHGAHHRIPSTQHTAYRILRPQPAAAYRIPSFPPAPDPSTNPSSPTPIPSLSHIEYLQPPAQTPFSFLSPRPQHQPPFPPRLVLPSNSHPQDVVRARACIACIHPCIQRRRVISAPPMEKPPHAYHLAPRPGHQQSVRFGAVVSGYGCGTDTGFGAGLLWGVFRRWGPAEAWRAWCGCGGLVLDTAGWWRARVCVS